MRSELYLAIIAAGILVAGCSTAPLSQLPPGIAKPTGLPAMDDPTWQAVCTWPKTIHKGDVVYRIQYYGTSTAGRGVHIPNFEEIDKRYNYSATYWPLTSHLDGRWRYGPFFGWRPDGSVYLRAMHDEQGNIENYYYHRDGTVCFGWRYDREKDVRMTFYCASNGEIVGCDVHRFENTWYRRTKSQCKWDGMDLSLRDYSQRVKDFKTHARQNF